MSIAREVFGSAEQQSLMIRGEHLLKLLPRDPRYCSHGRGLSLAEHDADTADRMEAVARLIGLCPCERVPKSESHALQADLRARGLEIDVYTRFAGSECETARQTLERRPPPPDVRVEATEADAPSALLEAYAEVATPHGVLPSNGATLRGELRPGFGLVAFDLDKRPIAVAAAVYSHHPEHPLVGATQWGQIATAEDRQGEGLALYLGALSIVRAFETLNATEVYTGIREGNAPSIALCTKLGVVETEFDIVVAIDASQFEGGRMTK